MLIFLSVLDDRHVCSALWSLLYFFTLTHVLFSTWLLHIKEDNEKVLWVRYSLQNVVLHV